MPGLLCADDLVLRGKSEEDLREMIGGEWCMIGVNGESL